MILQRDVGINHSILKSVKLFLAQSIEIGDQMSQIFKVVGNSLNPALGQY